MVYLENNTNTQTLYIPMEGVSGERRYGNYATMEYVDNAIEAETARTEATYIKKNELPEDIATKEYVDEHLSEYNPTDNFKTINEQSIIGVGDIHIDGAMYTAGEHISISDENVISTTGLPSTEEVSSAITEAVSGKSDISYVDQKDTETLQSAQTYADVLMASETARTESTYLKEHQSLEGYATEEWVEEQGYLTEHQDISHLATKTELSSAIAAETARTESTYLKEHQDISGKADITYVDEEIERVEDLIPSVEGLASEEYVDSAVASAKTEIEAQIPTKVSDLSNDLGFIDNTVNNLVNYYKKTETYTQEEINALVEAIPHFSILVVNELPATGESATVYLVRNEESTGTDLYDEWIYVNNAWEHLGTAKVDMSQYYTKTETDALLANKADVEDIPSLDGYATEDYVDNAVSGKADTSAVTQAISTAIASETARTEATYLKEHQDISGKADITYVDEEINRVEGLIPSVEGLASEEYVDEAVEAEKQRSEATYLKEHQSLANYYTKSEVDGEIEDAVSGKADTSAVTQAISTAIASETARTESTYLKEHQSIKTINEQSLIGSGNIEIKEGMEVIDYDDIDNEIALKICAHPERYLIKRLNVLYYPYSASTTSIRFVSTPMYARYAGTDTYEVSASSFRIETNTVVPPQITNLWSYTDYTKDAIDQMLLHGAPYIRDNNNTIYPDRTYESGWANLVGAYNKYDLISGGNKIGSLEFNELQGVWTGVYFSPMEWTGTLFQGNGMQFYGELTATTLSSADPNMFLEADLTAGQITGSTDTLVLQSELDEKQDTLTAGTGIDITDNVISVTGGTGGSTVEVEQVLSAGTKIATITVDDVPTDLYAPQGGGSGGGETVIELTQAQYDAIVPPYPENTTYIITDSPAIDMDDYQKVEDMDDYYTKTEVDTELATKADAANTTARSGTYFPYWNTQGIITGSTQAYGSSGTINGSSYSFYRNSSSSLPTIYAPTSAGTKDQVLLSNGSGAPVWSNSNVITAGLTMVCLTQEQYDAIVTKDPNTMYIIKEE